MLDKGAAVDRADKKGSTPLFIACHQGHVAVGTLLLDKGAEVDRAEKNGWTPLYIACAKGHVAVGTLLLDKGAAVDRAAKDGATPLSIAIDRGHTAIVALLAPFPPPAPQRGDATDQSSVGAPEEKSDLPLKVLVHEEWYDDTTACTVALETKLTDHQKELRRLKRLLAERETDSLTCPITYEIYEDPVIAADGYSYERRERCPHQATVVF